MLQQPRIELERWRSPSAGVAALDVAGSRPRSGRARASVTRAPLSSSRRRSAGPGDRLEVDRPDAARPAAVGADRGRRDDAGDEALDGRLLAGVQAGPVDPDPAADLRGSGGPAPAVRSIETRFGRTIATSGPAPGSRRALRVRPGDRVGDLASLHAADSLPSRPPPSAPPSAAAPLTADQAVTASARASESGRTASRSSVPRMPAPSSASATAIGGLVAVRSGRTTDRRRSSRRC